MAVIGIDLGTTYSAAARCVDGKPEIVHLDGEPTLPSVVGLRRGGTIAIGKPAKRNQAANPQNTIIEVKRSMGADVQIHLGEKPFTPQEISAMILKKIKELAEQELGEEVTGAVISCPAYFKNPERKATEEAGELAGLKVLKIINEPTAAAYAYGATHGNDQNEASDDQEKLFVVYDIGGGTFDVTVIRMQSGALEVLGTGGDPELGGGNFDDRIVDWIIEHLGTNPATAGYLNTLTDEKRAALRLRLKSYAEEGKKTLCDSQDEHPAYKFNIPQVDQYEGRPIVFNEILTMEKFEELIDDLMENSLKWVDEALKVPKEKHKYSEDNLTAILLVGGSTRVPLVRKKVEKRFPNTEIRGQEFGINPDEIVALGASIAAAEEDPEGDFVSETDLVDVTGHTLSVGVFDDRLQREVLSPIIPKETPIPHEAAHDFQSQGHGQQQCRVKVFQGEGREINPEYVTMISEFIIEIDPIQEPTPLKIGLNLDANGLLVAHATNTLTGHRETCTVDYNDSSQLTPQQLAEKKAQLESQVNAVITGAANPLDGAVPDTAANPMAAQPIGAGQGGIPATPMPDQQPAMQPPTAQPVPGQPPAAQPMQPQPMQPPVAPAQPLDPMTAMNPIMRNLYQKALNSYAVLTPDKQQRLMQLSTEIEQAAVSGDQTKLMSVYFPQLNELMQGIP